MSHSEDRNLDFVLKHYRGGAFDTKKAIGRFKDAVGIRRNPRRRWSIAAVAISAAAAILLGVFLFIGREDGGSDRFTPSRQRCCRTERRSLSLPAPH